ncbi:hypothetical protein GGS26DRAFT_519981 [Hypomontagnella submonticulosa]|nr:hypothetical protein GGS26DRAFT_519981 [Hypomontagnella submonticulosa]
MQVQVRHSMCIDACVHGALSIHMILVGGLIILETLELFLLFFLAPRSSQCTLFNLRDTTSHSPKSDERFFLFFFSLRLVRISINNSLNQPNAPLAVKRNLLCIQYSGVIFLIFSSDQSTLGMAYLHIIGQPDAVIAHMCRFYAPTYPLRNRRFPACSGPPPRVLTSSLYVYQT